MSSCIEMTVVRKFLFDTDFDAPAVPVAPVRAAAPEPPPPPPEPTFSAAELEAARQEAFALGYAQAEAAARQSTEHQLAQALAVIAEQLGGLDAALAEAGENAARLAIETGVAVAKRVVPAVLRQHPTIEIESLFRSCLSDLADEPRVVLRVADPLLDLLQPTAQRLASRVGFSGKVIVIGDDRLDLGDCRIEWADGGAERDAARLWRSVDEAVRRHLTPPDPPATENPVDGEHHGR